MSAYAALVSLHKILVSILYTQPRIIHNRVQLQSLLAEVELLLKFLDVPSTYKANQISISELETKMRIAARKAEDLIEHEILDSDIRIPHNSTKFLFFYFLYAMVFFLLNLGMLVSYVEMIPLWIQTFLVEAVLCTMSAVLLYMQIQTSYVIPALSNAQDLRGLMYDFEIIVKDVMQIKEARGDSDMSAHSALTSLRKLLDPILDSGGWRTSHLGSLHEMVSFLLVILENASITTLDAKIRETVSKAKEALIEFQLPGKFSPRRFSMLKNVWLLDTLLLSNALLIMLIRLFNYLLVLAYEGFPLEIMPVCLGILGQLCLTFPSYLVCAVVVLLVLPVQYNSEAPELPHVVDDFSIILRHVTKIKDAYGDPSHLPPAAAAAASASCRQDLKGIGRDVVVGLDSDLKQIKARLLQDSSKRELVPIVGMGGIGKTTLARQVFKDPDIRIRFDVCAWVTVSQKYSRRHVLLCLLDYAQILTEEKREESEDRLAMYLHKYLMHGRYLIVMDDVWDIEIWDFCSRFIPENDNGSRILITSRLLNVARCLDSSSSLHHMQLLNENDSWDLLRTEVFGVKDCPLEMESIGRDIAQNCGGLPLAIVVIGGLLCKDIQIEIWRDVAEKFKKSELQDMKDECLEILGLSYNNLPRYLRPCFLYMGVFLAHSEIPISTLINLWIAEGFLMPYNTSSQTLEAVAEDYLNDLVDRNLILVSRRSCNGKIRTCMMQDLLRDVCVENAQKEKFRYVVESGGYVVTRERPDESLHSLIIHPNALQVDVHDYLGFVHLRVLNVLGICFGEFPHQITKLVRLRYVAFHYDGSLPLPPSMAKLQDLETIVLHHSSFGKYSFLPSVIWKMPNLRHIYVKPGGYMFKLLGYQFFSNYSLLLTLQTLVGIRNFKWTKGIIEKIPNLKKLGISYDVSSVDYWSAYKLEHLVYLHKLESLKLIVKYDDLGSATSHDPPKLAFPRKLKKLSLRGCRIPWASMTAIGALPNLEALKLRCNAFCGPSWVTIERAFPRLIFLLLEEMSFEWWETDETHFPCLKHLVIRSCGMLKKIPRTIGDILTLERIELVDCHPYVVAYAKEIEQEQERMGKDVLKFHIEQRRGEWDGMTQMVVREVEPGFFRFFSMPS